MIMKRPCLATSFQPTPNQKGFAQLFQKRVPRRLDSERLTPCAPRLIALAVCLYTEARFAPASLVWNQGQQAGFQSRFSG